MHFLENARLSPLTIEGSFACPFSSLSCRPRSWVQKLVIVMAPAQK